MKCRCYNHRIIIEREPTPRDDDEAGGYALEWEVFTRAWCAIEQPTGKESLFAQQMQSSVTHSIYLPYQAGITAAMRVNYGGRLMNIRYVIDQEERRIELKLLAEEGVAT